MDLKRVIVRRAWHLDLVLSCLISGFSLRPSALAQPTAFTYQGRLRDGTNVVSGLYDLRFALFDDANAGNAIGLPQTNSGVLISNGLFSTLLDFGQSPFNGAPLWLQIAARTNGTAPFTFFSSRQQVTPSPYALWAANVSTVTDTSLSPNIARLDAHEQVFTGLNHFDNPENTFRGNGSGLRGIGTSALVDDSVTDTKIADGAISAAHLSPALLSNVFWCLGGNAGTTPGTQFFGTTDNQPLEMKVNGQRVLRLEPNDNDAPNVIGGSHLNSIPPGVVGATIGGGGTTNYRYFPNPNRVTADYGTVAGGMGNIAAGFYAVVGGGHSNTASFGSTVSGGYQNIASANFATVGGGQVNSALAVTATVGGGRENYAAGESATVGGGYRCVAGGNWATTGGGINNGAQGDFATVGGGSANHANNSSATVGGGGENWAMAADSTVGGGQNNVIQYSSFAGVIAGGDGNRIGIGASWGSVGGGAANQARANYSTVPGGLSNQANATVTFAAGQLAQANHDGAFVWSSYPNPAPSFQPDRAHFFGTNGLSVDYGTQRPDGGGSGWVVLGGVADFPGAVIQAFNGAKLTDGGIWQNASDRDRKTDFAEVSPREVLEKVAVLPVRSWRYTNETETVRHLGPVAQDFKAAFGLGTDDKNIGTVDADGVALAAIQGLNEKVESAERKAEVRLAELEAENTELRQKSALLEERIQALERVVLSRKSN